MASGTASTVDDWQTIQNPAVSDWQTVDARPVNPGVLSRAASFVGDTLSKTAHSMNPENIMAQAGNIDTGLGHGQVDWDSVKKLIPNPVAFAKDTYQKLSSGDVSGAIANIAPLLFIKGGPEVTEATGDAAESAANAVKNSPVVAGAKAAAPAIIKNLPVLGKPITAATNAFQDAVAAARDKAASNARDAAVAAQRANPRPSLADQAGIMGDPAPAAAPSGISPADIAVARQQLIDKIAARRAANTTPPARVSQAQQQGVNLKPSTPEPPTPLSLTPEQRLDLAIQQASKIAARQRPPIAKDITPPVTVGLPSTKAVAASVETEAPASTPSRAGAAPDPQAEDTKLLDGIAQGQTGKATATFARLTPEQQLKARIIASNIKKASTPEPVTAAPEPVSPATTSVNPSQSVQAPTVSSAPATIDELRAKVEAAKPEYYQPTGRATNGRIVPTPAELGKGISGDPDSSATLRVAGSENEKAFNVADFLFNKGVKNPAILDEIPTDEEFMEMARQHGKAVGNAVPQNKYQSTLHDKTLDLAKAHLQKMTDDEENGIPPQYRDASEPDLMELLKQSIATAKK